MFIELDMDDNNKIEQMNFFDLKKFDNTSFWNNYIILGDNLDDNLPLNRLSIFNQPIFPIKINFPMYLVCIDGNMVIELNLTEYTLTKNDIIFIMHNDIGHVKEVSKDCKLIMHAFKETEPKPVSAYTQSINSLKNSIKRNNRIFHLQDDILEEILLIHKLIKRKILFNNGNIISDIIQHYILGLLSSITIAINEIIKENTSPLSRQEQLFYDFLQKVQNEHNSHREVSYYAKELCISSKYLSKIIHEVSGKLAKDWIRDYVILSAKALLKSNTYTIQQVSYMLNFPNNSFFGKYFKSEVGCSPKEYQNSNTPDEKLK